MEKQSIKRFVTCAVPVHSCNFNCNYCYLKTHVKPQNGFSDFVLPPEQLIAFLSKDRLGGACYFNLCGAGETIMHPQLLRLVDGLTREGHFCDIITNGTLSTKFDALLDMLSAEQKERLLVKFSFHWLELKRTGLLDEFVSNVRKCKRNGVSYSVEITPEDALIPHIEEIKAFSMEEFGALPHITVTRDESKPSFPILTKLAPEEYKKIWGQFDSEMFQFKIEQFGKKQKNFCYAGEWSIYLDLESGDYRQCYDSRILGNITDKNGLHLSPVGHCSLAHCFNCHAFLTLGVIPEVQAPSYLSMRDRITADGSHWVNEAGRAFFSTKLYDSHKRYSDAAKRTVMLKEAPYQIFRGIKKMAKRALHRIH